MAYLFSVSVAGGLMWLVWAILFALPLAALLVSLKICLLPESLLLALVKRFGHG